MQSDGQEQAELTQQQAAEQQEGPDESQPISSPNSQERSAEQQAQIYLDQLQRTQADLINYRRRANQELADCRVIAQSELISTMLPVLDDLGRALIAAPPDLRTNPWVQGLFLVASRLNALFDQLGLQQIGAPGEPFDPRRHEALMTEEKADLPEGTIAQVFRPGYTIGERIIRPAQVSVASTPSAVSEQPVSPDHTESGPQ